MKAGRVEDCGPFQDLIERSADMRILGSGKVRWGRMAILALCAIAPSMAAANMGMWGLSRQAVRPLYPSPRGMATEGGDATRIPELVKAADDLFINTSALAWSGCSW